MFKRLAFPAWLALCALAVAISPDLPPYLAQDAAPASAGSNWAASKPGDWVEYAMADGPGLRLEVAEVKEDLITYRHIVPVSGGEPLVRTHSRKASEIRPVFQPAPGAALSRGAAVFEVGGAKLNCEATTWTAGSGQETATGAVWYCNQVPCGGLVKQVTNGKDTMWLTGFARGPEVQSQPQPQPQPQPKGQDFGEAITLEVPAGIRKEMEDQAVAITRLRVYFDEAAANQDGAALEFEDLHTEVPVIFAAFLGERCDRVLNYADFMSRNGRYVDLAFQIKTLPAKLEAMKVQVEHSHIQGDTDTVVSTFDVPRPEPGEPWNDLRLRGARPGVNRYRLVVSYTNSLKETTTYRGFSHWVFVQAPPMFEFTHTAGITASARRAGSTTLLSAEIRLDAAFLLHHGLRAQDCSLRLVRRGKREMRVDGLSPEVRRVLEKERAPLGWQELGRGPLSAPGIVGVDRAVVEDSFARLTFRHVINASSATLPLDEDWEYRFELLHTGMVEPLAVWEARVRLKVSTEADIDRAKLVVTGSAIAAPVEASFVRK